METVYDESKARLYPISDNRFAYRRQDDTLARIWSVEEVLGIYYKHFPHAKAAYSDQLLIAMDVETSTMSDEDWYKRKAHHG